MSYGSTLVGARLRALPHRRFRCCIVHTNLRSGILYPSTASVGYHILVVVLVWLGASQLRSGRKFSSTNGGGPLGPKPRGQTLYPRTALYQLGRPRLNMRRRLTDTGQWPTGVSKHGRFKFNDYGKVVLTPCSQKNFTSRREPKANDEKRREAVSSGL